MHQPVRFTRCLLLWTSTQKCKKEKPAVDFGLTALRQLLMLANYCLKPVITSNRLFLLKFAAPIGSLTQRI